jgi:hypothetical protein
MKSFTASTRLGLAKVHLPDIAPGQPSIPTVIQSGTVLASGIPTSVEGPALSFPTDGEPLVCVPQGQVEVRRANRISVPLSDDDDLADTIDATYYEDVAVTRSPGMFAADGLPVVWGARLGRGEASVRGFTFEDGEQVEVNWTLDLVPVRRKCCGQR